MKTEDRTEENLLRKAKFKYKKFERNKKMINARVKQHKNEIENIKEKIKAVEEKEKNPQPAYF